MQDKIVSDLTGALRVQLGGHIRPGHEEEDEQNLKNAAQQWAEKFMGTLDRLGYTVVPKSNQ